MLRRHPRDRQRGNSLLLALIVMSALATLGSLTVVSMQSSLKTSTNDRTQAIALYAAESGAAVTMDYLRRRFTATVAIKTSWFDDVVPNNVNVPYIPQSRLPSNRALPSDTTNNLFSPDQNAWYEVQLFNNRDDVGFGAGGSTNETDGVVIIRSTGHGPQGAVAIIEWEVQRVGYWWSTGIPHVLGATYPAPFPVINPPSVPWAPASWYPPPLLPLKTELDLGLVLRGWHVVSL